jgi:hypothetical protein
MAIRCGGDGVDIDGNPIGRQRRKERQMQDSIVVAARGEERLLLVVVEAVPRRQMQRGRVSRCRGRRAGWNSIVC